MPFENSTVSQVFVFSLFVAARATDVSVMITDCRMINCVFISGFVPV